LDNFSNSFSKKEMPVDNLIIPFFAGKDLPTAMNIFDYSEEATTTDVISMSYYDN